MNAPLLFALEPSRAYGAKVARALGLALAEHEERTFEDGERKLRPLAEPEGRNVYVLQSLFDEPSHNLHRLQLFSFLGPEESHEHSRKIPVYDLSHDS